MSKQIANQEFFKEITELLNSGKSVSFLVKGTSMKPLLPEKTEVFLRREEDYYKNDICLFLYQEKFLLHRIKKIENNRYFFQGDNSGRIEDVDKTNIYGRVYQFNKKGKIYKVDALINKIKLLFFRLFKSLKKIVKFILRGFKK